MKSADHVPRSYFLSYGNETFRYSIERSTRRKKTIGISVDRKKGVVVRAPEYTSTRYIKKLVEAKAGWIAGKAQTIQAINLQEKPPGCHVGEILSYLGQEVVLVVKPSSECREAVVLNNKQIIVALPSRIPESESPAYVINQLQIWLTKQAQQIICDLVAEYSAVAGLIPNSIKIKDLKRSWGSCSGKNNISFNWRLVMARPPVIAYVVAHELCHIKEKNHSARFWQMLDRYVPDCKKVRRELKLVGHKYDL